MSANLTTTETDRLARELRRMANRVAETNMNAARILEMAADIVHASIRQSDALAAAEASLRHIASGQGGAYEAKTWISIYGTMPENPRA